MQRRTTIATAQNSKACPRRVLGQGHSTRRRRSTWRRIVGKVIDGRRLIECNWNGSDDLIGRGEAEHV